MALDEAERTGYARCEPRLGTERRVRERVPTGVSAGNNEMMARPRRFASILACKKYKVLSALLAIYNLAVASASEDLIDIDPSSLAVSQSCESYKSASRALILNLRPSGGPRSSKRRTIMNTSSTTCSSLSTKHDVSLIARMKIKRNSPNLVAFAENHRPALPLVPCDHQPARVVAAGPGGGSQPGRGGTGGGVHRRRRLPRVSPEILRLGRVYIRRPGALPRAPLLLPPRRRRASVGSTGIIALVLLVTTSARVAPRRAVLPR